ncbi:hypothetical protein DF3PA_40127 [Candidatus Defluviicoccus seviourii]|uniref:Uncharacterized protein n=2 Tax=root TaxID=1 RepID=A0A564WG27_9PROT|nr:hypothetical protein DF3PB_3100004 [uncultured Defluviicoccus sp.]VUX47251.1 hypothetical protein DF3PA_40127 [Candidatus Defluviicoccus seviourii]
MFLSKLHAIVCFDDVCVPMYKIFQHWDIHTNACHT